MHMLRQHQAAELREAWRQLTAQHAHVSAALERALQDRHGISATEYEVLQRLAAADDGKRRMQELVDEIHLSQSALSRLVGRLEDAGLVTRSICDHDRRGVWACVTASGRDLERTAAPTRDDVLATTLAR